MNNEKLKDSLSAMMDNASNDLEVRRVLANADEELMATWSRYQIVRSVLRKENVFPKLDIVSGVSEAILKDKGVDSLPKQEVSFVSKERSVLWGYAGKLAVAASVLALTLSTVYFLNDDGDFVEASSSVYAKNEVPVDSLNVVSSNNRSVDMKVAELLDRHEKQGVFVFEKSDLNTPTMSTE